MRYVPNLIPETSKVLPGYFKGSVYKPAKKNTVVEVIMWFLGILFFLFALAFISHPLACLLYALLAFILIPPGHRFLEKKLRFRLVPKIKAIVASALFIGTVPLANRYIEIDRQQAAQLLLLQEKTAKEKALADQKEQQRKDSLSYYIQQILQAAESHNLEYANGYLQYAETFVRTPEEKDRIEKEKVFLKTIQAIDLVKAGKYKVALAEITDLLALSPTDEALLYNSAICKRKTGDIQGAVNDLKPLVKAADEDAIALHDEINPVRKRISFYVTRCCDGSTSNATGRGACSSHGGVCNWREPVYEEYRKYG